MNEFNWTCPYCQRDQTVSHHKFHASVHDILVGENPHGRVGILVKGIGCSNPNCKKITITAEIFEAKFPDTNYGIKFGHGITNHKLWPESSHKIQPNYIPQVIVQDYIEACRIRDLSPKASATLSRRCIQGIIRDFCKISSRTLYSEIDTLKEQVTNNNAPSGVTLETVDAMDHVRAIGNIGAHMEKDINVIIDVDAGEAQALIELIELLFEEWYVALNSRQAKLAKVQKIGAAKAEIKKLAEVKSQP